MNKKLITLAVAAAMAAPAAVLAEATIYGVFHNSIDYVDVDEYALWGGVPMSDSGDALVLGGLGSSADIDFRDLLNVRDDQGTTFGVRNGAINDYGYGALPGSRGGTGAPPANVAGPASANNTVYGIVPLANQNTYGSNAQAAGFTQLPTGNWTNGTTTVSDDEGRRLFGGADVAASDAYNTALNQGLSEDVATVRAIQAQYEFAQLNTTAAQQLDAATNALIANQGANFNGWDLNANERSNRIGVKGSEDLGGGLKAIYQVELNVRLTDSNDDIRDGDPGRLQFRNSFVGLAGNFGTFLVGRHDTPLKISTGKLDMFADTLADYNHTVGFHDVRADNAIAYISPSFSGFQFAGAVIPSGGSTPLGAWNPDADGIADAWSVAGIYKNGPFYAGLGYENLGDKHWQTYEIGGISQNDWYRGLYNKEADDDTKWRVGLGLLDWNGFSLTGIYENRENVLGAPKKADVKTWQVQAGYSFGNNTIKGMYGQADVEACADPFNKGFRFTCSRGLDVARNTDKDTWAVAFDHNFSKRTRAYILYTQLNDDQDKGDWSGFSLGMIHKF